MSSGMVANVINRLYTDILANFSQKRVDKTLKK